MRHEEATGHFPKNGILAALAAQDRRRLAPHLEWVTLTAEETLLRPGEKMPFAYFPLSGVVAKLVGMGDGGRAEVGIVGREGMFPIYLFLGLITTPFEIIVQNTVEALRLEADFFRAEVGRRLALHESLLRYTGGFLGQVSHSAACNRLHTVEQRYCRWLLMTHDRVGTDEFLLKQEFAGNALGVRRMTITPVARRLQQAGIIRYMRGRMTILARQGIEELVCECYQHMSTHY